MTLFPVIERELRAESRSAFTYWLRVAGGASLLGAGLLYFMKRGLANMAGEVLFQKMQVTLFVAIWIVALLMTADSISRERREGTLGLLFLTPLKPFEVVLAKGVAHGLRTATIMLAAIPVLVVPFLMGGVSWREALAAVLIDFSALCWALAAGLFASSFNRTMTRSLVWSAIVGLCALVVLVHAFGAGLISALKPASTWLGNRTPGLEDCRQFGWVGVFGPNEVRRWMNLRATGTVMDTWLIALAVIALASVVIFGLMAVLAAQGMKRMAKDRPKSVVRQRVEKELFTPTVGLGFYRRWMRHALERNPVGWLERRSWQARLVTWSWLAVVMSLMSWMLGQRSFHAGGFNALVMFLAWVLVGNVAVTAAGSLRRERETGVIELLLVSPLSTSQIVSGRVRSIVGQFLPAAVLIFGAWLWLSHVLNPFAYRGLAEHNLQIVGCFLIMLLTVPLVGLYFSLRCRMFVVALFWTAVTTVVVPWLAALGAVLIITLDPAEPVAQSWQVILGIGASAGALALFRWRGAGSPGVSVALAAALAILGAYGIGSAFWRDGYEPPLGGLLFGMSVQIGIAAWLGARLRRRLERRDFALPQ